MRVGSLTYLYTVFIPALIRKRDYNSTFLREFLLGLNEIKHVNPILVPGTFKFLVDTIKIIITVTIYARDVVNFLNQESFFP